LPKPRKSAYQIAPVCNQDLFAIWRYIAAESGERQADKIEARFFRTFARIARNPGIGHTRYDLTDVPFLFFAVHSWLVVYDRKQDPLSFQAILHGARDVRSVFAQRYT
jgi:toxin ParE1/3/4